MTNQQYKTLEVGNVASTNQPGTLEALQKLSAAVGKAGIPKTTHYLMHVRASQINGCSVCLDMHSRELVHASEQNERIFNVAAWRETPNLSGSECAASALHQSLT